MKKLATDNSKTRQSGGFMEEAEAELRDYKPSVNNIPDVMVSSATDAGSDIPVDGNVEDEDGNVFGNDDFDGDEDDGDGGRFSYTQNDDISEEEDDEIFRKDCEKARDREDSMEHDE